MVENKYSDYISLNKNFKDNFDIDKDLDTDLWKSYYFTDSFTEILSKLDFLFKSNNSKKKAVILTGTYGIGKSITLAVISHLLWDNKESIQGLLDKIRTRAGIPGATLEQYREEKKYFPVFLSGRDSSEVSDEKTLDYLLQKALENSLNKYGFLEKIQKKSDFELYCGWLQTHQDKKDSSLLLAIESAVKKSGRFETISELIEGLDKREPDALSFIKEYFNENQLNPPYPIDSFAYYSNIFRELQKIDDSISGIMIYWDEFTTVFTHAGQSKKVKLLQRIQEWSQNAPSNIILFLISHKHPDAFRPLFPQYNDEYAKISDRFEILNMKMEKNTTYTLIENSIIIKDINEFSEFLGTLGFDSRALTLFSNQFTELFKDVSYNNEKLKKTLPLHPYSVYAATKIADSIGSAERSIFQLLHSNKDVSTGFGRSLGFSAFLTLAPSDNIQNLYTLDMVFDFFYDDFKVFSQKEQPMIVQTMVSFARYYSIVENLGADAISVFKTIILMQILHETSGDKSFATNKNNLEKALYKSSVKKIDKILEKLVNSSVLMYYDKGNIPEESLYKIRVGDINQKDLDDEVTRVTKEYPFSRYVMRHDEEIKDGFQTNLVGVSRLTISAKANNVEIINYASSDIEKIKADSKRFDEEGKLFVGVILSQTNNEFEDICSNLKELTKKYQHHIFIVYDEQFDNLYKKWVEAVAHKNYGEKNQQKPLIEQGNQQEGDERSEFKQHLNKVTILFQGTTIKKRGSISEKINEILNKIYPRGFDYLTYNQFWETPRKYHETIFNLYGKTNARKQIEDDKSNFLIRKVLDVFRDKNGNPLIDNKLLFQNDESTKSSPLYEIVTKIRSYLERKTGHFISIQTMINELGLEQTPYGLCGWYESIILVYALAEFKTENRLEVKLGKSTPLKDSNKIIDAIKDAVTHSKKDHEIRYGSDSELKISKKLIHLFSLEDDSSKTLVEVCVKVRQKINETFGLPLWVIPYAYDDDTKEDLETCLTPLNRIIIESDRDKLPSDADIIDLSEKLKEIEKKHGKTIWSTIFTRSKFQEGFEKYVDSRQPALLKIHTDINILIDQVKANLEGECWVWNETKVTDFLTKILKTSIIPSQPQNLHGHFEDGGMLIKWDSPLTDNGTPLQYIIQRRDEKNVPFIETIDAKSTMFKDTSVIPGTTYSYQIIAKNAAGQSPLSNEFRIQLSLVPPQITCKVSAFDDFFEIKWEKVGKEFDLDHFTLLRGCTSGNLSPLDVQLSSEMLEYKDYDVEAGKKYFFRVDAFNKDGIRTKGIVPQPTILKKIPLPSSPTTPLSALYQNGVQISWAIPEMGSQFIDNFCIYRQDGQKNKKLITILSSDNTSYLDDNAVAGETYSYSISSKNVIGESSPTDCGTITIPSSLPPDIKKWQELTISFAKKDPNRFFKQFNEIIDKIISNSSEDLSEKEKEALRSVKKLLEGITNE